MSASADALAANPGRRSDASSAPENVRNQDAQRSRGSPISSDSAARTRRRCDGRVRSARMPSRQAAAGRPVGSRECAPPDTSDSRRTARRLRLPTGRLSRSRPRTPRGGGAAPPTARRSARPETTQAAEARRRNPGVDRDELVVISPCRARGTRTRPLVVERLVEADVKVAKARGAGLAGRPGHGRRVDAAGEQHPSGTSPIRRPPRRSRKSARRLPARAARPRGIRRPSTRDGPTRSRSYSSR